MRRTREPASGAAALSDEALTALRHRAEKALAIVGVTRTHLGDDVLVTLTMDGCVGVESEA